jgi:response regulator of citrate/malate metabolism
MNALVIDTRKMIAQILAGMLVEVAGLEFVSIGHSIDEACDLIRIYAPDLLLIAGQCVDATSSHSLVNVLQNCNRSAKIIILQSCAQNFCIPEDLQSIALAIVPWTATLQQLLSVITTWGFLKKPAQRQRRHNWMGWPAAE